MKNKYGTFSKSEIRDLVVIFMGVVLAVLTS